jgi:hypothetical protein
MKTGPDALDIAENESERTQNIETGPNTLRTAKNESGYEKT